MANGDFALFTDLDLDGYQDFLYNVFNGLYARNTGEGKFKEIKKSGIS